MNKMTLPEQLRARNKALTVEELAGLLCIAVRTLYKEVEDDHVPFFRVRTSIRFDPHQVADWLEMKMPPQSIRMQHHPQAAALGPSGKSPQPPIHSHAFGELASAKRPASSTASQQQVGRRQSRSGEGAKTPAW